MGTQIEVEGIRVQISGRLPRIATLADEGYEFVDDPEAFLSEMRRQRLPVDVLTFTESIGDPTPRFPHFHTSIDEYAVLSITTYDHWWKHQVNDKTRNMVRKGGKKGLVLRPFALDEGIVKQIKKIYDECPIRQGRPFKHYDKSLEVLMRDHATYADKSEFIGAFDGDELVGFIKLVHQNGWSSLMQIISFISQRDKAPTNALIAKAVEVCANLGIPKLQYGIWSRRSIGDFKERHGFERYPVPRYYVPTTPVGSASMALGMHRPLRSRIPERYLDQLAAWRGRWNSIRVRTQAQPQSAVGESPKG